MAANPVLVDSSYYIHCARQGIDPLQSLAVIAAQRDLAVCGVVRCEVGRGIRQEKTWRAFQAFWNVMQYVPTDNRLWDDVEATLWQLDRDGLRLPLTDVVIACCARRIQAVILTFDQHFQHIPGVRAVSGFD
jgi:predicted nucleic acid-binding protein